MRYPDQVKEKVVQRHIATTHGAEIMSENGMHLKKVVGMQGDVSLTISKYFIIDKEFILS